MLLPRGVFLALLILIPTTSGEDAEHTNTTTANSTNNELVGATTEEPWVTPFPPGDILNDPWFRKIKYVFPKDKTVLDGLRNMWPYTWKFSKRTNEGIFHSTRLVDDRIVELGFDRTKLYCYLRSWPWEGIDNPICIRGDNRYFNNAVQKTPLGMLQSDIPYATLNAICAAMAMVFGIFGNILVFVSVVKRKELRTSTNLLLAGVTVIDCLNSLAIVLHGYPYSIFQYSIDKLLGLFGCYALKTIKTFLQFAAINHLVTISFERYFAICWPLKRHLKFTPKKVAAAVVFNWLLAAAQVTPYSLYVVGSHPSASYNYYCKITFDYQSGFPWTYYSLVLYLLLPVLIQCFTYGSVVRTLLASIKKMKASTGNDSGPVNAERTRLKLVYMLITLVVIYIITVLPAWINNILLENIGIYLGNALQRIKRIVLFELLQSLNSSTNIVVYTVVSRQFRQAFKEMLCCGKRQTSPKPAAVVPA